jgi:catechol 2,3-dioxygenase-like lactoylglutathione lyase family enzyme
VVRPEGERDHRKRPGILGCDYVSVPVDRLDEGIAFYRDALGLKLSFVIPDRWAEFDLGTISLALYPREAGEGHAGDVGLLVDDLEAEKTRLESKGIEFPHGIERFELPSGRGRLARFHDPFGNRLELMEWLEPRGRRRNLLRVV